MFAQRLREQQAPSTQRLQVAGQHTPTALTNHGGLDRSKLAGRAKATFYQQPTLI